MNPALRIILSVTALALGAAGLYGLVLYTQLSERNALMARDLALDRMALAPGSALACLDAGAGDTVENACEQKVFATAQSTAAAVRYMGARLTLLAEAAKAGDAGLFPGTRRAVALDRFGVAAYVLANRDGCTPMKCPVFALVEDASALKANLRAEVFDQYVSRYEAQWNRPAPQAPAAAAKPPPVAQAAPLQGEKPLAAVKPGEHWDFPSAASIPAVSIMKKEPPLPKGADAQAQAQAAPAPLAPVPNPPLPLPQPTPPSSPQTATPAPAPH
jgi:hypothetical protein